jgi:hypothetical protein
MSRDIFDKPKKFGGQAIQGSLNVFATAAAMQ